MIYQQAEDSELLKSQIKKYAKNKSVLDLGSGSGILAEEAIISKARNVLASDINPDAIRLLKQKNISSVKSDLFLNIKGRFDLIIFNPPYLPEDAMEPKSSALSTTGGKKGDEIILKFLKQAGKHLNPHGKILLLLSSLTPKKRILNLLESKYFRHKIITKKKIFFEELYVLEISKNIV
ncbi:MAG: methyltransferase [Candidatus Pacearchaeota archaeon]|nr:methyltransferase [Candidatus Pacearchaeota archaeon]